MNQLYLEPLRISEITVGALLILFSVWLLFRQRKIKSAPWNQDERLAVSRYKRRWRLIYTLTIIAGVVSCLFAMTPFDSSRWWVYFLDESTVKTTSVRTIDGQDYWNLSLDKGDMRILAVKTDDLKLTNGDTVSGKCTKLSSVDDGAYLCALTKSK